MHDHVNSPVPQGCPDEATLAALSDGTLAAGHRALIAEHVATCDRCLAQVGALVRLDRTVVPIVPAALRERARVASMAGPGASGWRAGMAVAAAACLSLGGWFYAQRSPIELPASQPQAVEQVRSRGVEAPTPNVLSPSSEGQIANGPLDIAWQPTANALAYRVRVMRDDGSVLWEGEAAGTSTVVGATAGLPRGTPLYVTVTALLPDGKTARSPAVRFQISPE